MKRTLRVFCLLLAVLLVALPPLQAYAAIGTGTAIMIGLGATAVVGSVLAGLGIMPGSDGTVWENLVDACIASDGVSKFLGSDGLIQVLQYTNLAGNTRFGVLQNLIEAVFGWIWKSNTVEGSSPSTSIDCVWDNRPYTVRPVDNIPLVVRCIYYLDTSHTPSPTYPYRYICHFYAFSDSPGSVSFNSTRTSLYNYGSLYAASQGYTYVYNSLPSFSGIPNLYIGEHHSFADLNAVFSGLSFSDVLMYSSHDLSLGNVAAPDVDLFTAYPNWSSGSIALPHPGIDIPGVDVPGTGEGTEEGEGEGDDTEEGEEADTPPLVYWPTGVRDLIDAMVQEDVIAGEAVLENDITATPDLPIVGGITGDIYVDPSIPDTGDIVIPNVGEGILNPSISEDNALPTETPSFALNLTKVFPFCIPFDIYNFLSVLCADPEAPVFQWQVPVPQLGKTFDVEIDLSPWDDVAKLFRTLELLLFIVGLAMVTRDRFIRS